MHLSTYSCIHTRWLPECIPGKHVTKTRHKKIYLCVAQTETRELQERLQLEKEAWEENYKKKHDTWLLQKERELKEQVRKERDKEIELVIARLEEDSCATREESEKAMEMKMRSVCCSLWGDFEFSIQVLLWST